jgi:(4S)-4-hydroxy-5-phosphonooxypentane-2,3-dione isomerase
VFISCVHLRVKPENRDAFMAESLEDARNSIHEPGNLRFDVLQQADDPNCFLLYEVYRDEAGAKAHKETPHYKRWAEAVKDWMAEPRTSVKYTPMFPDDLRQWSTLH